MKVYKEQKSNISIYLDKHPFLKTLLSYFPSVIFCLLVILLIIHFKGIELTPIQFVHNIYLFIKSEPVYSIIYIILLFYFADWQLKINIKKIKSKV